MSEVETVMTEDEARRAAIEARAFGDGRFVMYLFLRWSAPVCFTPKLEEGEVFLRNYALPFFVGVDGVFHRTSWQNEKHWIEYIRWRDVLSVQIHTAIPEQHVDLDAKLAALVADWYERFERARSGESPASPATVERGGGYL